MVRPFPPVPPLEEYEHLTEKQRMLAGYPYRETDPELQKEMEKANRICREFNDCEDEAKQIKLLKELFHPSCRDKTFKCRPNLRVAYGYNISVGSNLQMNADCCLLDCAPITIGNNCIMAPRVQIYTAYHPLDSTHRRDDDNYYEMAKPIKIGNQVCLGGHSIICPGVTIGNNVTIRAGSVVTKNIPSNVVVAGNPAKIIKQLPTLPP